MSSPTQSRKSTDAGSPRRSSGALFENLMSHKRGADNTAYSQRRLSMEEQGASKGAFGKMWDTVIRGAGPGEVKK